MGTEPRVRTESGSESPQDGSGRVESDAAGGRESESSEQAVPVRVELPKSGSGRELPGRDSPASQGYSHHDKRQAGKASADVPKVLGTPSERARFITAVKEYGLDPRNDKVVSFLYANGSFARATEALDLVGVAAVESQMILMDDEEGGVSVSGKS